MSAFAIHPKKLLKIALPLVVVGVCVILLLKLASNWLIGDDDTYKTETDELPKVYAPVHYDVASFDKSAQTVGTTPKEWLASFGVATAETALDWQGATASRYRLSHKSEPLFYVVDSDGFFEMNWYYPTAKDSDGDKAKAKNYASRTYAVVKAVAGEQAMDFFDELLKGETPILPQNVPYARCENYRCQVVIQK